MKIKPGAGVSSPQLKPTLPHLPDVLVDELERQAMAWHVRYGGDPE